MSHLDDATSIVLSTADEPSDLVKAEVQVSEPMQVPVLPGDPTLDEIVEFLKTQEKDSWNVERKRIGVRAANYYFGRLQLKELEDAMRIEFKDTWRSKRKQAENIVRSVSNQLSVIYKAKTRRVVRLRPGSAADKLPEETQKALLESQGEIVEFIYKKGGINKAMKEVERFAKWAKSVPVMVTWNEKRQTVQLRPFPPQFWDIMFDDDGNMRAVIISTFLDSGEKLSNEQLQKAMFWVYTAGKTYILNGNKAVMKEVINPLGILPFFLVHDEEPFENDRDVLVADSLLVNTNLSINLLLSDSLALAKYQTYGQPWIANVDEDDLPTASGHEEVWHLKQSQDSDAPPAVGVLQPEGDFDGLMKIMERVANGYATTRGLPANSFSSQRTVSQSGVALKINNAALVESRDTEEEKFTAAEWDLWQLVKGWHNLMSNVANGHELPPISDDVWMTPIFPRNDEVFESPGETQRTAMTEVTMGLLSPADFLRQGRFRGMTFFR